MCELHGVQLSAIFRLRSKFLFRENYPFALGTNFLPRLLTRALQNGVVNSVYSDGTVVNGYRCASLEKSHNSSISEITVFY